MDGGRLKAMYEDHLNRKSANWATSMGTYSAFTCMLHGNQFFVGPAQPKKILLRQIKIQIKI